MPMLRAMRRSANKKLPEINPGNFLQFTVDINLANAELDLAELDRLPLGADDGLGAAIALANALVEILTGLHNSDSSGLLYFAVETAK